MNKITKAIAVLLVFYSLVAGMLVPLNTGIYQVTPMSVDAGEDVQLKAKAYNAAYSDTEQIEARLRLNEETAICAKRIEIESTSEVNLFFDIPSGKLPIEGGRDGKRSLFPLLEISNGSQGKSLLESAVFINQKETQTTANPEQFCAVVAYPANESMTYPYLNILQETIRNLYYHVPMWFAMLVILFTSVIYSIMQLSKPDKMEYDIYANSLAAVGLLFGLIGIATGALWAKHTWGAYWSFDVKQNTTAVALLIYLAYFVLRSSFDDMDKRARISAIYNIFAFATLIPLLYVVPRMVDSLHPGSNGSGNPGFNTYDLDNTMRMVFYPAIIGWILMGLWMAQLMTRVEKIRYKRLEDM
jgi:heme exporter protein C